MECMPGDPKGVDPQLTEAIKHAMELWLGNCSEGCAAFSLNAHVQVKLRSRPESIRAVSPRQT